MTPMFVLPLSEADALAFVQKGNEFREKHNLTGGVVLISGREVIAWAEKCPSACDFAWGVYSEENGTIYLAEGIGHFGGATRWTKQVPEVQP